MSPKTYLVYRAVSPSGKSYVGITCQDFQARVSQHFGFSREPRSRSNHFAAALRKYGKTIEWRILERGIQSHSDACERERYFVRLLGSNLRGLGYNGTPGGDFVSETVRDRLGRVVVSDQTRLRMSEAAKDRGVTGTQLRNLEKGRVSRLHSDTTKSQMRARMIGTVPSVETRQKMSLAHQGRVFSAEHRRNKRNANQQVPDSARRPKAVRRSDGAVYDSMAEAARSSKLSVSQVRTSIKTGRPTQQDFTFTKVMSELSSS